MNELLKTAIRTLIETVFQVITGPGSHDDKAERLERATAALASETAAEASIKKALK